MIEPHTHPEGAPPASAGGVSPFFAIGAAIVLQAEASRRRLSVQPWPRVRAEHAAAYAASEADWARPDLDEHGDEHLAAQDRLDVARAALDAFQPRTLAELHEQAVEFGRWGPDDPDRFDVIAAGIARLAQPTVAEGELRACPFCGSDDIDPEGLDDGSPEEGFMFAEEPQAIPPPGGWHPVLIASCRHCKAIGPVGWVMNSEETAVLTGPTWNNRAGEVRHG